MHKKDRIDALGATLLVGFSMLLGLNQVLVKLVNAGLAPVFQAGLRSALAFFPLLAWALFANGLFDEAVMMSKEALRLAPVREKEDYAGYLQRLEHSIDGSLLRGALGPHHLGQHSQQLSGCAGFHDMPRNFVIPDFCGIFAQQAYFLQAPLVGNNGVGARQLGYR